MSKQSGMMKLVDKIVEQREEQIRWHSRQMTCDYAVIALGRMGWGEKRLNEFCKLVGEVSDEYAQLIVDDWTDDPDIEYSKAKLDEELKQYCGKSFVPYDERYKW